MGSALFFNCNVYGAQQVIQLFGERSIIILYFVRHPLSALHRGFYRFTFPATV